MVEERRLRSAGYRLPVPFERLGEAGYRPPVPFERLDDAGFRPPAPFKYVGMPPAGEPYHAGSLPAVVGGMTGLHCHENGTARGADITIAQKLSLDGCASFFQFHRPGDDCKRFCGGRRTQELDGVFGGDRAGWLFQVVPFHQTPGCRPIEMTVEQSPHNATVNRAVERLVLRLGRPCAHKASFLRKTFDAQPIFVGGSTAKANAVSCVGVLQAG